MMKFSDQIQNIKRMKDRDNNAKDKDDGKVDLKANLAGTGIDLGVGDDKVEPKSALDRFEDQIHGDVFIARFQDSGDESNGKNARVFISTKIIELPEALKGRNIDKINLADNAISDFGMHAIKTLINSMNISYLNLASNMISGDGLECILEDLIKNQTIKHLDLGVVKGSIRKNSLGIQGAICISALLIRNKVLETLWLDDNDLGVDGGEWLGIALAQNESIRTLRLSENDLKSEGAIPIIKSSGNLEVLDLSKNFLVSKSDVGKSLWKLLKTTKNLKKLYLEFNELMVQGCKWIAKGLKDNSTLQILNIKGNIIGDDGCVLLAESLVGNKKLLKLDISLNEIGSTGFQAIWEVLQTTKIEVLTCSKNFLGDEMLALFSNILSDESNPWSLKKFDFSSCRLNDTGLLYLINALQNNKTVSHIKLIDNYFSEDIEAILLQTLNKNTSLIEIALQRNRLSHSCLSKIKKITSRNQRMIEEDEPNRLKAEIYRLRYEHQKLEEAKQQLKSQKEEIERVKGIPYSIYLNLIFFI